MILTKSQLQEFTRAKRRDKQIGQLEAWSIPYRLTITGEVVVLWSDVTKTVDRMGQQPDLGSVA